MPNYKYFICSSHWTLQGCKIYFPLLELTTRRRPWFLQYIKHVENPVAVLADTNGNDGKWTTSKIGSLYWLQILAWETRYLFMNCFATNVCNLQRRNAVVKYQSVIVVMLLVLSALKTCMFRRKGGDIALCFRHHRVVVMETHINLRSAPRDC